MRIHELLEASIDYVAVEGALGADPLVLRDHLRSLDANVDETYFVHLWTQLVRHPCFIVAVARDVLPDSYPVPEGAEVGQGAPERDDDELFTFLEDDDGGSPPVRTEDLGALLARYPGRVRVRCTDDEIYYRLTGSRKKITAITAMIFTYLQLAARGREQGVSALELGPLTGTNQKSVFHYIRVLTRLGLCAKVPTSMHGSTTSILVYRRFLEQNPHYRAYMKLDLVKAEPVEDPEPAKAADEGDADMDDEGGEGSAQLSAQDLGFNFQPFSELELVAGHIPKQRLLQVLDHPGLKNHLLGRHHLLQVIGWPEDTWEVRHRRQLQRHINALADQGLVEFVNIGSSVRACLRLTKFNPDYVPKPPKPEPEPEVELEKETTFSLDDYAEPFQFQGGATLTQSIEGQMISHIIQADKHGLTLADLFKGLSHIFKRTIEHVVNRHDLAYLPPHLAPRGIRAAIESHQRIRRLRIFSVGAYRVYLEELGMPLPSQPGLEEGGHFADLSFRRFASSPSAYNKEVAKKAVQYLPAGRVPTGRPRGRPPKPATPKVKTPKTPKAKTPKTPKTTAKRPRKSEVAAEGAEAAEDTPDGGGKRPRRGMGVAKGTPKAAPGGAEPNDGPEAGPSTASATKPGEEQEADELFSGDDTDTATPRSKRLRPNMKEFKYKNDVQERGRPRKYIYIVNKDGSRNRKVMGNILSAPHLPSVLIYLKEDDTLVPGPPGYNGVGAPPPLTEEQLAAAQPLEYYGKPKATPARSRKRKARESAVSLEEEETAPGAGPDKAIDDGDEADKRDVPPPVETPAPHPAPEIPATSAASTPSRPAKRLRGSKRLDSAAEPTTTPRRSLRGRRSEPVAVEVAEAVDAGEAEGEAGDEAAIDATLAEVPDNASEPSMAMDVDPAPEAATQEVDQAEVRSPAEPLAEPTLELEVEPPTEPGVEAVPPDVAVETQAEPSDKVSPSATANTEHALQPLAQPAAEAVPDAAAGTVDLTGDAVETPKPADDDVKAEDLHETKHAVDDEMPLRSILDEPIDRKPETPTRYHRVDIAVFRRANEVYQSLIDSGGVMSDIKLYHEQSAWSKKYAGTDHPNAPTVASNMDRKVFKRMVRKLVDEGRVKERTATTPTTTGRWIKVLILYITGTEESDIQGYIRELTSTGAPSPGTPSTQNRKEALQYSAYRRSGPRQSTAGHGSAPGTPTPAARSNAMSRRELLLADPIMATYNYGFQSGRVLRARILHSALVRSFAKHDDTKSLISRSPRIFAFPYLYEDLTVRDYFSIVQVRVYDDELYRWLQVPENLDLPLRDMPVSMKDRANLTSSRNSAGTKLIVRTLLSLLSFLQLITPLAATDEENAVVFAVDGPTDQATHFARSDDVSSALYFLVYDVAPVYNIADPSLSLLGFMPVTEPEHLEPLWDTIRAAAVGNQTPVIERMAVPSFPFAPDVSGVLDMVGDHPRTLRAPQRWRHDIRLAPEQRTVLDATIVDGQATVTEPDDIARLAHENALPASFVERYIQRQVRRLQRAENPHDRGHREVTSARMRETIKRQKEKELIRDELAARIRAAREVYDQRVKDAAARAGIEVTPELRDYIIHNRPMTRMGQMITDAELSAIVDSYVRAQAGFPPPRRVATVSLRPAPTIRASKRDKAPKAKDPHSKTRRHRHNWTKEEEELLVDAEAVIRARCRGTHQRGRLAMDQLFPEIGDQVLRTRLKRLLDQPGRQMYYERLEDAYYHLWVEHRGSAILPDPNPASHIDFDLRAHVNFLRERVNKSLLRLPIAAAANHSKPTPDLPLEPKEVVKTYEWEYLKPVNTSLDQLVEYTTMAEDTRLHNVSLASIVDDDPEKLKTEVAPLHRRQGCIRSLLKMIVATPNEVYSMADAAKVLSMPREEYEPQIAALVNEGVLNKNSNNVRTPGRMYGFAPTWNSASEGTLPAEVDAEVEAALARVDESDKAVKWPLIESNGDLMALMTMVSNGEVEFDFDIEDSTALHMQRLTYNTRSLNDDAFEFDFAVRRTSPRQSQPHPAPNPLEYPNPVAWPPTDEAASKHDVERVVAAVQAAGADGLERAQIYRQTNLSLSAMDAVLASLASERPARVFWAGYDNARLVARKFWSSWTLFVNPRAPDAAAPRDPHLVAPCMPRRWVDIWGDVIPAEWRRAVKAAVAQIIMRPGITEHQLRARLSPILDRMETSDVLQYLLDAGLMQRQSVKGRAVPPVHATDAYEVHGVVWAPMQSLWA